MPQSIQEYSRKLDREDEKGFKDILKDINKLNRGKSYKEKRIASDKRQLDAMESQAEKTGTKPGLAEAFRKKRAGIMKAEGFPDKTSTQKKEGQIYKGLPKGTEERAKKIGRKIKLKNIRVK